MIVTIATITMIAAAAAAADDFVSAVFVMSCAAFLSVIKQRRHFDVTCFQLPRSIVKTLCDSSNEPYSKFLKGVCRGDGIGYYSRTD